MAGQRRNFDKIDRKILRVLQEEGRISFTDLGERVGLSTTPCTERVRRLERDGVIMGYHARVSPVALDAGLLVFVEISMSSKSGRTFEEFRREVLCVPQVSFGPYRVDFALFDQRGASPSVTIVECDGHDYHERTKEQAQRDR